jgi:hypothetical protein
MASDEDIHALSTTVFEIAARHHALIARMTAEPKTNVADDIRELNAVVRRGGLLAAGLARHDPIFAEFRDHLRRAEAAFTAVLSGLGTTSLADAGREMSWVASAADQIAAEEQAMLASPEIQERLASLGQAAPDRRH